jgi:hypothetical protein
VLAVFFFSLPLFFLLLLLLRWRGPRFSTSNLPTKVNFLGSGLGSSPWAGGMGPSLRLIGDCGIEN